MTRAKFKRQLQTLATFFRRRDLAHPVPGNGGDEPLAQGSRYDICLLGIYPSPNNQLVASAYDGQLCPSSQKHKIAIPLGKIDPAKARALAQLFVAELGRLWDQKYGSKVNETDAGIGACIEQVLVELQAELGHGATYQNYHAEAMAFLRLLGPKRCTWPPSRFDSGMINRICGARLRALDPKTATPIQALRSLRYVLRRLGPFGFDAQCVNAIRLPRRPGKNP